MPSLLPLSARRILLTGGAGFVARHLAPMIEVVAPDALLATLIRNENIPPTPSRWMPLVADLTNQAAVDEAVRSFRPDLVLHLAAQSSVGASAQDLTWRVNLGGSLALAEAIAIHAPGATVLFTSSAEVYGRAFLAGPVTEEATPQPQNAYGRSKLAAEGALGDILSAETRLIVARAFNHTGPGQDERFVIPSFAMQIARIEAGLQAPLLRVGNLDVDRDFLHVLDVCEAYLALIGLPDPPGRLVVNVASGRAYPLRELLDAMRSLSTTPFDVEQDPLRMRPSDIPAAVGDNRRLVETTGWFPTRTMELMLRETIEAARAALASGPH